MKREGHWQGTEGSRSRSLSLLSGTESPIMLTSAEVGLYRGILEHLMESIAELGRGGDIGGHE